MSVGFNNINALLRIKKIAFLGKYLQNAGFAKRSELFGVNEGSEKNGHWQDKQMPEIQEKWKIKRDNVSSARHKTDTTNNNGRAKKITWSEEYRQRPEFSKQPFTQREDRARWNQSQATNDKSGDNILSRTNSINASDSANKLSPKSTASNQRKRALKDVPSAYEASVNISEAFGANNIEHGFQLLNELAASNLTPHCSAFISYWDFCRREKGNIKRNVERMLEHLRNNGITITKTNVDELRKLLNGSNALLDYTEVSEEDGTCNNCQKRLDHFRLSQEEFKILKKTFQDKVMANENFLLKTNSKELSYFHTVVRRGAPFDLIIDGLNLAFSLKSSKSSAITQAKTAESALRYFVRQKKRVLFVGRKHMELWPDEQRKFINLNSTVFLTKDSSSDDPYILYAALISGPKTNIFTRDLMKDHARLLGPDVVDIFWRWQREHQFFFRTDAYGQIEILPQIKFNIYAHKIKGTWHVPYRSDKIEHKYDLFEIPNSWACINL